MADLGQTDTVRIAGGAFTVDSVADQKAETEHLALHGESAGGPKRERHESLAGRRIVGGVREEGKRGSGDVYCPAASKATPQRECQTPGCQLGTPWPVPHRDWLYRPPLEITDGGIKTSFRSL